MYSSELNGLYKPIMDEDRGICWFRYLYFKTKPHIVSLKSPP
ncbi:hypothetical protein F383_19430 [Gossypium arboreum]|uniref:Uncharacterized protein n=1 Tax=Gossypium arboreum TaxID=29729 RepID=A0A0B0NR05_GOSAR|nr:hypothetical protein F383_19430 [Gossypium arboreum]